MLIATSVENECHYCVAAHTTVTQAQKLDQSVIGAVRNGGPIAAAERVATPPGACVFVDDLERAEAHGGVQVEAGDVDLRLGGRLFHLTLAVLGLILDRARHRLGERQRPGERLLVGEQRRYQHADLGPGGEPGADHVVLGILKVVRLAQPAAQAAPLPRCHHAQSDVAVLAGKDRIGVLVLGAPAPPPTTADAGCHLPVCSKGRVQRHNDGIESREVDVITCAAT